MCQILGLIDNTNGKNKTYLLRFSEKKFKQEKCSVVYNGRRYYSDDNIKVLYTIKTLLNDEGLTLNKEAHIQLGFGKFCASGNN